MSMYDGEDFFFQIDSHMEFQKHWDDFLIDWSNKLYDDNTSKSIISSYPPAFRLNKDGASITDLIPFSSVYTHVVADGGFKKGGIDSLMRFKTHITLSEKAIQGFHLGAGCLFAPGVFVEKFPYDPYYYFHGEEQALALRLFTHGWNIYHIPDLPVFHLYNEKPSDPNSRALRCDSNLLSQ